MEKDKNNSAKSNLEQELLKLDGFRYWAEMGIDVEKRRIMLDEDVCEYNTGLIIRALRRMVDDNLDDPIDFYINTYGGSVYDGLALYDVLESLGQYVKIRTHALGKIMSMGLILYLSGNERYSSPRSTFMAHTISSGVIGKAFEMDIENTEVKRLEDELLDILAQRTRLKKSWWKKQIKYEDCFYNKDRALELGIVTNEEDDFGFDINITNESEDEETEE